MKVHEAIINDLRRESFNLFCLKGENTESLIHVYYINI